jgi:hypothetical protein
VTASMPSNSSITVSLAWDFKDGKMVRHSQAFALDNYFDSTVDANSLTPNNFRQLAFVRDVPRAMIHDLPEPTLPGQAPVLRKSDTDFEKAARAAAE